MISTLIIFIIITVFITGFVKVYNRHSKVVKKIDFAGEYRDKFVDFSNKYFQTYDSYSRSGEIDDELYIWLTMKVTKIQYNVGSFGVISYKPAFKNYMINKYPIIINTLPKFRQGHIEDFDVDAVDDCLLRYLGFLEEYRKVTMRNLRNPIVWLGEGFREILSIPIFILGRFDVISIQAVKSIKDSLIYKVISALIGIVTLISGFVTIIVGYDQVLGFVNRLLGK